PQAPPAPEPVGAIPEAGLAAVSVAEPVAAKAPPPPPPERAPEPVAVRPVDAVPSRPAPVVVREVSSLDEPPPIPPRHGLGAPIIEDRSREKAVSERKPRNTSLLIPIIIMLVLLLAAAGVWFIFSKASFANAPVTISADEQARVKEEEYLRSGWKTEAVAVLGRFLNAETAEKKSAYVLNPAEELPVMKAFYASRKADDSDAPAIAFAAYPLPESDRRRGMFMMMYDQPPQLKLREAFYPLPTLEVQNGLEDPDMLLSSAASASNFASEQIKVQAMFKRTPQGLKLDWPTFVQTKYRTFRDFLDSPAASKSGVFRVLIQEDVPDKGKTVTGSRAYKVYDPGNVTDFSRVNVAVDSDTGRSLSEINWIGTKNSRMDWRTATVELAWSTDAIPQLTLKRFVCWEFLGLGGDAGVPGK
ncbi:MAG: hypothetical protein JWO82_3083, partial [Akkermansiaceae bacterium]|nr:hypothetical protein [Akkermansiaceae bacterium]